MRATSSIRSSSICKSKRKDGGNTVSTPSACDTSSPKRCKASKHWDCVSGMPMILAARATRNCTGVRAGMAGCWSSTGPHVVSAVPQISRIRRVMCSMCSTVDAGSTPRSKRWPASVEKLKRRERPAIALGHQNAASTYTLRVSSDTAVASPPMMPASDSTCTSSAITPTSPSTCTVLPLSSLICSPALPQRTSRPPWILSRSKICDGRPNSNIT